MDTRPRFLAVTTDKLVPAIVDIYYDFKTGERRFGAYELLCASYEQRAAFMAQILAAGDLHEQQVAFDRLRKR